MILWYAPYRAVNGAGEQARSGIQTGTDMKAGESMLIENRIERYVTEVTSNLPVYDRGRAGREISAMIRDMIRENAGGREPDILDARAVIGELGSPADMAGAWLEMKEEERIRREEEREAYGPEEEAGLSGWFRGAAGEIRRSGLPASHLTRERVLNAVLAVLTVLAVCLVAFGLIALGTRTIHTMLPVFLGCVMALLVMTGRGVLYRQSSF
jgi:hypothetical protein